MKRTLKRLGAALLVLCMVMTMLPVTALAAGDVTIKMGGAEIYVDSGTGWAWDATGKTLTLDDTYEGSSIVIVNPGDEAVTLVYDGAVTVESNVDFGAALQVTGKLEIEGANADSTLTLNSMNEYSAALRMLGETSTITLSGNITAAAAGAPSYGIVSAGTITIVNGAKVTATGSDSGINAARVDIEEGAVVKATSEGGTGIYAEELTIHGGDVTAESDTNDGIHADEMAKTA